MSIISLIILKVIRLLLIVFEILFIKNVYIVCKILDNITIDIRLKIVDKLFPRPLKMIKHDHNSFYVSLHGFLIMSPEYFVNRIWVSICDTLSSFVPSIAGAIDHSTFVTGTFGMIGLNSIEVFDINNNDRIMAEKINDNFLVYRVDNDNLRLSGATDNINGRVITRAMNSTMFSAYVGSMLSNNIRKLSFINTKIYSIATQSLDFDHPVMELIRLLGRETMYDRVIFSGCTAENTSNMDLSSLHKFTRSFYMEEELMLNFHFYKYCQQMQRILETFVMRFCEKYSRKIDENPDIERFVNIISYTFNYNDEQDNDNCNTTECSLTIDDVLIAMIFNVIEYSMNRIFIEQYWDKQKYFPCSRNGKQYNVISRIEYSTFMPPGMNGLVGENNRRVLIGSMQKLYARFKADSAPFIECINPDRMKGCALGI